MLHICCCAKKTVSIIIGVFIFFFFFFFPLDFPCSDVTVRVSALTLYGAVVTTQAPLPEVQLLLQQPDDGSSSQDSALSWRQRNGEVQTSAASSKQSSYTQSPQSPRTPVEKGGSPPWLLKLCLSLVTQPREDHFDSEGGDTLEPLPVRLAALQVRKEANLKFGD